jgi:hypothetical protein
MKRARRAAWILFTVGLTIGTLSDKRTITIPRQQDGFWILVADFHVHSFFGDGALPPWDLRREAERRGLDVIAITNHNQSVTSRFGAWLSSRSPGPMLLPGMEITAPHYHVTTAGTEGDPDWRPSLPAIIDAVHAQGGVAIAAHPGGRTVAAFDDDEVLARLDGIEGTMPVIPSADLPGRQLEALFGHAVRVNPRISFIGGSDFHFQAPLGAYRTYLLARERTKDGVLDAIRNGRTVACDFKGRANGHEALLRLVRADCAAAGHHGPERWARVAKWCAWAALMALVVVIGPVEEEAGDSTPSADPANGEP